MVDTPTKTPYHSKALPEGSILREWKLESVLGVGGFGIVYRGRGVYFDELVAIKEYFPSAISDRQTDATVCPTDSSSEEVYALGLRKFVEEAKILWNLSKPDRHPNIVAVKSLFEINGTAYMVMDFETGVSLSQMLRNGQTFDEARLLGLLRPIAEGLDRVHKAGVIHRDIKPANILVNDDGHRPVLIDFGSARFESGQATSTQVTFYTPPYAAIEQYVKTFPQGPWTDIYALGVALYQCVTGEKPGDALERMHGGLGEPLSARERPGYSRTFTRAVDAAMALRPSERPQSMPQWLNMFEPGYDAKDDEVTRISVSARMRRGRQAPEEAVPPVVDAREEAVPPVADAREETAPPVTDAREETAPPVADAPAPTAATDEASADEPAARRAPLWALLAGVGVLLAAGVGAAGFLYLQPHHTAAPSAPAGKAAPTTAASPTAAAAPTQSAAPAVIPSLQPIEADAAGLLADAQRAGRPRQELGALGAANSKIDALAAQLQTAPAAAAPPLVAKLDGLAVGMARTETGALSRLALAQSSEVETTLGAAPEGSEAVAAVRQARASLAAASAGATAGGAPVAAIDAARRSIPAYAAFSAAYARATPLYAVVRRAAIPPVAAQARAYAGQIAALAAAAPRPWVFASQGRKQSYQDLQADATRAKTLQAQAEQLAQAANGQSDPAQISATLAQITEIKGTLGSLYASATATAQANK
jgi:non-specific serine/threonine protein kinase